MRVPLVILLLAVPWAPARVLAQSSVGEVSFANSGAAAAQADFLAGLAQLHNFEFDFAAQDFARAQKIDPDFVLAYWGEAMTYNHPLWAQQDAAKARAALQRLGATAPARAARAKTERERDFLEAVEILYGDGTKFERDFRYADFMKGLHDKYPEDPETTCFYALALLGTAHNGRDLPTYMRAAALLEEVFHKYPRHPGAAHYLIHSFDDPLHAPLGLRAAYAYAKIAPEAGHAQHMTSHIFLALGMWDDVVSANETATAVVNRQRAAEHQPPSSCGHYSEWLDYAYLQQGRFADARKLAASCRDQGQLPSGTHKHGGRETASFIEMRGHYVMETESWSDEMAGWKPAGGDSSDLFDAAYVSAFAAARRQDAAGARQALVLMEELATKLPAEYDQAGYGREDWNRAVPGIKMDQIRALLLQGEKKFDQALVLAEKASREEEALPYAFGPPAIAKPSPELVGELLLERDRPAEAKKAFELALAHAPGRVHSLRGLLRSQKALGDSQGAARTDALLRQILRHSHPSLAATANP